jgi:hypothetical protein
MEGVPKDTQELLGLLESTAVAEKDAGIRVRLPNGQLVRLFFELDDDYGFQSAKVSLDTPRSEQAIIAALIALAGRRIGSTRVRRAARAAKIIRHLLQEARETKKSPFEAFKDHRLSGTKVKDLQDGYSLERVEALLRHYRPNFELMEENERFFMLERAAEHVRNYLDSLQALMRFLEDGDPREGNRRRRANTVQEQLRAAELKDILGKREAEIARVLNLPRTTSDKTQGGNQKARKRAKEGTKTLVRVLGEEGYDDHVRTAQKEAAHYESLSEESNSWCITRVNMAYPSRRGGAFLQVTSKHKRLI